MSKLHLVGFRDWLAPASSGLIENPARLLIEEVKRNAALREEIIGAFEGKIDEVRIAILPVPLDGEPREAFAKFRRALADLLRSVDQDQDLLLAFGQGSLASQRPVLEAVFRNKFKVGNSEEFTLKKEEPLGWEIGLRDIAKNISTRVEGMGHSEDAGAFYCNALGFAAFEHFHLKHSLFVHLPGLPTAELAEIIWHANEEKMRAAGINSAAEMPYATLEQNVEMIKKLVSVWKPFEF